MNQRVQPFPLAYKQAVMIQKRCLPVVLRIVQHSGNFFQRKIQLPIKQDLLQQNNRLVGIVAVSGIACFRGLQQADFIVIMQRAHADAE